MKKLIKTKEVIVNAFSKNIVVFIGILLIFGCSNPENNSTDDQNSDTTEVVVEDALDLTDPEVLGTEIGEKYKDAIFELFDLLEGTPDVDVLKPQVIALREEYIQIFFALGEYNEAMSEEDRTKVSSAVYRTYHDEERMEKLDSIYKLIEYYRPLDNDLANYIADFNIITQYSFYDLLIKQEPEEARRLGILED